MLLIGRLRLSKVATNSCRLKQESAKSLETFGCCSSHLTWLGLVYGLNASVRRLQSGKCGSFWMRGHRCRSLGNDVVASGV